MQANGLSVEHTQLRGNITMVGSIFRGDFDKLASKNKAMKKFPQSLSTCVSLWNE